jgi:uncharacterized protein YaaQ
MHFKLILVVVDDAISSEVADAAREAGATGVTLINTARGEGVTPKKTFLGLSMENQCDVLLLVVEEHLSRRILERISSAGSFDTRPGRGIALQIDVEDVVGVSHQVQTLSPIVEDEL